MLKVEIYTNEIPEIFSRFKDVIGEKHWLKRAKLINQEIKGHKYLNEYLHKKNSIVFSLTRYSEIFNKYRKVPYSILEDRELYPAISFSAQALSIIDLSASDKKMQMIRRIHGAFKNPDDMRAMQLELVAATHFVRQGYSVSFPEMDNTGSFDLLVNGIGDNGLEIECKSVSSNKGKKIHQRESLEFYDLVSKEIMTVIKGIHVGLSIVLTLPNRLPSEYVKRKELVDRIKKQILVSQSKSFGDGCDIRITKFDYSVISDRTQQTRPTIGIELIDQITSTQNRGAMIIGNHNGGGVVFAMQSRKDDKLLDSVFKTLSKSAKNQISKTRPALFVVGFSEIGGQGLKEVAQQDFDDDKRPTALRLGVSKFFNNQDRDCIIGVNFLDDRLLKPKESGDVESGSTSYIFKKDESSFWHDDFKNLFK